MKKILFWALSPFWLFAFVVAGLIYGACRTTLDTLDEFRVWALYSGDL